MNNLKISNYSNGNEAKLIKEENSIRGISPSLPNSVTVSEEINGLGSLMIIKENEDSLDHCSGYFIIS